MRGSGGVSRDLFSRPRLQVFRDNQPARQGAEA